MTRSHVSILLIFTFLVNTPFSQASKSFTDTNIFRNLGFRKQVDKKRCVWENKRIRIVLHANSKSCTLNGLKFILSDKPIWRGNNVYVSNTDYYKLFHPVLLPKYIRRAQPVQTIVLDPGHGGKDSGAKSQYYQNEAYYTLKVAREVARLLQLNRQFRVILTRYDNRYMTLDQRVAVANRYPQAIFISIHFNAARNQQAQGIETFTLSPKGVPHYGRKKLKSSDFVSYAGNYQDEMNIALATSIHGVMRDTFRQYQIAFIDRGIKRARYNVLTTIKHPAILIEGGFLSNKKEAKKIHSKYYQAALIQSIVKGIEKYARIIGVRY